MKVCIETLKTMKSDKYANQRADRPKKRSFCGNQYNVGADTSQTSASAKKIAKKGTDFETNVDASLKYCMINFFLFLTTFDLQDL